MTNCVSAVERLSWLIGVLFVRKKNDVNWLNYSVNVSSGSRYITHCDTWHCRISAIKSMLLDCKQNDIYILRNHWQKSKDVIIPRSDGTTSSGKCQRNYVRLLSHTYCVCVKWCEDGESFTKLVPLKHYTDTPPSILTI